jgi:hypothetical protein
LPRIRKALRDVGASGQLLGEPSAGERREGRPVVGEPVPEFAQTR